MDYLPVHLATLPLCFHSTPHILISGKGGTLPEIILWFTYQGREVGFLCVPVFARAYGHFFLGEYTLVAVAEVRVPDSYVLTIAR